MTAKKAEKEDVISDPEAEVVQDFRKPGDIIKEYVQNGLRYRRVVTEGGGTVDMKV